jgi:phage replication O-like protein O
MIETHPKKYCMIKTEIIEALAGTWLCSYEAQVLFAIIRKTYGWELADGSRKTEDWISYSQLKEITGIRHDSHLSRTISSLISRSIVTKGGNKIGINKDVGSWLKLKEELPIGVRRHDIKKLPIGVTKNNIQIQELPIGVTNQKSYQSGYEELPRGADTKETTTKEIDKERTRKKTSVMECSEQKLWEIAVKFHVSIEDVKRQYGAVLLNAEKYKYTQIPQATENWVRMAIERGNIEPLCDLAYRALVHDTPEYLKKRDEIIKQAQEQEEMEYAERHRKT